jgi:hypothetical protein
MNKFIEVFTIEARNDEGGTIARKYQLHSPSFNEVQEFANKYPYAYDYKIEKFYRFTKDKGFVINLTN